MVCFVYNVEYVLLVAHSQINTQFRHIEKYSNTVRWLTRSHLSRVSKGSICIWDKTNRYSASVKCGEYDGMFDL